MKEFITETHTCAKCQTTIRYTNIGGWYNAKTRLNKGCK